MIKYIKIGNAVYKNIGLEELLLLCPKEQFKKNIQETISWLTDRYIHAKLNKLDEDLADLASELQYLNGLDMLTETQQTRKQQILNIIAWKEQIWAKEAELEAQVDNMTFDELLQLDVEEMCNEAYKDINLEY